MMTKKSWGIGAWAAEAEREEAEEKERAVAAAASGGGGESKNYPSLREAVVTAKSTTKKKTKMTLQEFTMQSNAFGPGGGGARRESVATGLTPGEMLLLPTGPKERSADEMQYGRIGGGFPSYGRGPPPGRVRDGDGGDGNWTGNRRNNNYGGFDDDRRGGPPPRVSDYDMPSRADEVDNWAMGKKPMPLFDSPGHGRPNRQASLGRGGIGGEGGSFSRADEVDNWAVGKKPVQVYVSQPRSSSFGSTFRDSRPPPDNSDRWTRGGGGGAGGMHGGNGGDHMERPQERPRLVLEPRKSEVGAVVETVVKMNKPSPFGAARPREEILAEKGLDWKKVDQEIEAKKTSSRPTSSHSSRPGSAQSSRSEGPALQGEGVGKSRPKVNPFGDAKPREVLLQEKGLDWRKIDLDLEHRSVERPETEEEKSLKEEIDHLKRELEKESASNDKRGPHESEEDHVSLRDQIIRKEKELELLIRELDDKVRFGQKAIERPGSGAGRVFGFSERPPSQSGSGSFEDSRSFEFMDRPRSRGTGDQRPRPLDDRRGFQGGRERGGFLGSRDLDRSRSRDRW